MFSKLVFIIDGEEIEFHAHELVKIAQQLVNEVQIAPAHVPDYESYPANLHKKVDSFMTQVVIQYEKQFKINEMFSLRSKSSGVIKHPLLYMLELLYKTNMTCFLSSGLHDAYSKLLDYLDYIKAKEGPCLINDEFIEDIILPPNVTGLNTISKWLSIADYLAKNSKDIPVTGIWFKIANRLILLKNMHTERQHFYVSDHGFIEQILHDT